MRIYNDESLLEYPDENVVNHPAQFERWVPEMCDVFGIEPQSINPSDLIIITQSLYDVAKRGFVPWDRRSAKSFARYAMEHFREEWNTSYKFRFEHIKRWTAHYLGFHDWDEMLEKLPERAYPEIALHPHVYSKYLLAAHLELKPGTRGATIIVEDNPTSLVNVYKTQPVLLAPMEKWLTFDKLKQYVTGREQDDAVFMLGDTHPVALIAHKVFPNDGTTLVLRTYLASVFSLPELGRMDDVRPMTYREILKHAWHANLRGEDPIVVSWATIAGDINSRDWHKRPGHDIGFDALRVGIKGYDYNTDQSIDELLLAYWLYGETCLFMWQVKRMIIEVHKGNTEITPTLYEKIREAYQADARVQAGCESELPEMEQLTHLEPGLIKFTDEAGVEWIYYGREIWQVTPGDNNVAS